MLSACILLAAHAICALGYHHQKGELSNLQLLLPIQYVSQPKSKQESFYSSSLPGHLGLTSDGAFSRIPSEAFVLNEAIPYYDKSSARNIIKKDLSNVHVFHPGVAPLKPELSDLAESCINHILLRNPGASKAAEKLLDDLCQNLLRMYVDHPHRPVPPNPQKGEELLAPGPLSMDLMTAPVGLTGAVSKLPRNVGFGSYLQGFMDQGTAAEGDSDKNVLDYGLKEHTSNVSGFGVGNLAVEGQGGYAGNIGLDGHGYTLGNVGVDGVGGVSGNAGLNGKGGSAGNLGLHGFGEFIGNAGLNGQGGMAGNVGLGGKGGHTGNLGIGGKGGLFGNIGVGGQGGFIGNVGIGSVLGNQHLDLYSGNLNGFLGTLYSRLPQNGFHVEKVPVKYVSLGQGPEEKGKDVAVVLNDAAHSAFKNVFPLPFLKRPSKITKVPGQGDQAADARGNGLLKDVLVTADVPAPSQPESNAASGVQELNQKAKANAKSQTKYKEKKDVEENENKQAARHQGGHQGHGCLVGSLAYGGKGGHVGNLAVSGAGVSGAAWGRAQGGHCGYCIHVYVTGGVAREGSPHTSTLPPPLLSSEQMPDAPSVVRVVTDALSKFRPPSGRRHWMVLNNAQNSPRLRTYVNYKKPWLII